MSADDPRSNCHLLEIRDGGIRSLSQRLAFIQLGWVTVTNNIFTIQVYLSDRLRSAQAPTVSVGLDVMRYFNSQIFMLISPETVFNGVPASCFPASTGLGASFDVDLADRVGKALGDEARAKGCFWHGRFFTLYWRYLRMSCPIGSYREYAAFPSWGPQFWVVLRRSALERHNRSSIY